MLALSTSKGAKAAALQDQAEAYQHMVEDLPCSAGMWRMQFGEGVEDAGMFGYDGSSSSGDCSGSHCSSQGFTQLTVLGDSIPSSSGYSSSGYGSDDGSDGDSGCCSSSYAPALRHVSDTGAGQITAAAAAAEGDWPLATIKMNMSCPLLGAGFFSSSYSENSSEDEADE